MKQLKFRFKDYNDVFNIQLERRFYDCHKIDLMDDEEILISAILNRKSGVIYAGELFQVRIMDKSSFFSSQRKLDLFLNDEFFCKFSIGRQKQGIELNDGRIFSLFTWPGKLSFKEHNLYYELEENQEIIVEVTALRYWDYSFEPKMEYNGEITFKADISKMELLFFLHLILLDCISRDPKNN